MASYCANCGNSLGISDHYCSKCGQAKSYNIPSFYNSDRKTNDEMKPCPVCDGTGLMSDWDYGLFTVITLGILPIINGGNECMSCKGTGKVKKDFTYLGSG